MSGPRLLRAYTPRGARGSALRVLDPLPLAPRRLFWIKAPRGALRAGHAHRTNTQLVAPLRGAVIAWCAWWTGGRKRTHAYRLAPGRALLVPPRVWLELRFAAASLVAVLASEPYRAASYICTLAELRGATCGVADLRGAARGRVVDPERSPGPDCVPRRRRS